MLKFHEVYAPKLIKILIETKTLKKVLLEAHVFLLYNPTKCTYYSKPTQQNWLNEDYLSSAGHRRGIENLLQHLL